MSSFAPVRPKHVPPMKVAADTYVIHSVQDALGQPLFVYLNSMVILGAQPMIVDTVPVGHGRRHPRHRRLHAGGARWSIP